MYIQLVAHFYIAINVIPVTIKVPQIAMLK